MGNKISRYLQTLLLSGVFLLATIQAVSANQEHQTDQPNIIFILVDDMGWNGLSSYGNEHVMTPNIDRLADEGMKFTQAYVAPECTPTRAAFLSGQYGARTGMTQVHHNRIYPNAPLLTPKVSGKLRKDNYTVANMLRDAGYVTAISGKWHVGAADRETKNKYYGFDFVGTAKEKPWNRIDKDKATPAQTEEVIRFIEQQDDRPFFVYLSYYNIHTPLQAPDSLVAKYVDRGYPESTHRFGNAAERPTAHYLAMTELLDHNVGRLLDRLEELKLSDQTLIVFMSDNGGLNRAWNNTLLRGAKGQLYEGGIRVPMIVKWPGKVQAGSETGIPVHIVDLYATFKEVAGGNIPDDKVLDGVNLLPVLTGQGGIDRDALYWHHPHYIHDYGKTPSSAIREGDYKLIYYYGDYLNTKGYLPVRGQPHGELKVGEKVELFNIHKDPHEQNNLSEKKPQKAEYLLNKLKKKLQSMNAPLPKENPDRDLSSWYEFTLRN